MAVLCVCRVTVTVAVAVAVWLCGCVCCCVCCCVLLCVCDHVCDACLCEQVGVGASLDTMSRPRMPGWDVGSCGYHADDGKVSLIESPHAGRLGLTWSVCGQVFTFAGSHTYLTRTARTGDRLGVGVVFDQSLPGPHPAVPSSGGAGTVVAMPTAAASDATPRVAQVRLPPRCAATRTVCVRGGSLV